MAVTKALTPTAPFNKFVVTVGSKFADEITTDTGSKFFVYVNTTREEHATLLAKVVSVPQKIKKLMGYEEAVMPDIKKGDQIMMRYDVIFNIKDLQDRTNPVYKNELFYQGRSYWFCDILQIFGVKRGEKWAMINGYVMMDIIEETKKQVGLIINPFATAKAVDKAVLRFGGDGRSYKPGDTIYFIPQFVQTYGINGKYFYLIRETYIYGYSKRETTDPA